MIKNVRHADASLLKGGAQAGANGLSALYLPASNKARVRSDAAAPPAERPPDPPASLPAAVEQRVLR